MSVVIIVHFTRSTSVIVNTLQVAALHKFLLQDTTDYLVFKAFDFVDQSSVTVPLMRRLCHLYTQ